MALQITISGTDRTRLVVPESLRITNALTRQVDTCSFQIKKFGSRSFAPAVANEVIITQGATKLFAGRIVAIDEDYRELDKVVFKIECVDYTRDLDRKLVIEEYENQTINAIIADIASKYFASNITLANVSAAVDVKYIKFNYEYPSKCLQQLADMVNYDWYIDYDRDLHFFAKEVNPAPFALSDENGNYIYGSLIIRKDITPLRNTIVVRGGEYKGDPFTVERTGDGVHKVFGTEYKFSDLQVTVTGQQKSIGVDPLDDPTGYDLLYNFQEKFIRFRDDKIPTTGSSVKIMGYPWLPVLVKLRDTASVDTFSAAEGGSGIYEFKVIDKSIRSKEGARQRARAELLAYATTLSEGEFETYVDGLRAGQRIHIQSDVRNVDEYYIINKVVAEVFDEAAGSLVYRVSFVTTKTFDYIDLLQKLVLQENKQISFDDEVLDQVETGDETMVITETVTHTADTPPYQWGSGGHPQLKWEKGEWS